MASEIEAARLRRALERAERLVRSDAGSCAICQLVSRKGPAAAVVHRSDCPFAALALTGDDDGE